MSLWSSNVAAFVAFTCLVLPSGVSGLEPEILGFPIEGTVARYVANEVAIEQQRSIAQNVALDSNVRNEALRTLNFDYPLAARITARALVVDSDTAVALAAIDLISTAMVMMNHEHDHQETLSAEMQHMMDQFNLNIIALRRAEKDPRDEVHIAAASTLVSMDDVPTYTSISLGVQSGRYSSVEASNLFTLGSSSIAAGYLEPYLGSGEGLAETTALSYLGALPAYQEQIRETYFLNNDAPEGLRVDAARVLGSYDSGFGSYALQALPQLQESPALYSATVQSYLSNAQMFKGAIDPDIAKDLSSSIEEVLSLDDVPRLEIQRDLNLVLRDLQVYSIE